MAGIEIKEKDILLEKKKTKQHYRVRDGNKTNEP